MMARSQRHPKTLLVVYHARGVFPLRRAISNHLMCWNRYSSYQVKYFNTAFENPASLLTRDLFDVIVFDTSFLALRWKDRDLFLNDGVLDTLSQLNALKIIVPQDEFVDSQTISEFVRRAKIGLILSCADKADQKRIYPGISDEGVSITRILTGYVDDQSIETVRRQGRPLDQREYDIVYRAWDAEYWIGRHGIAKSEIGKVFKTKCTPGRFKIDVSVDARDTISGRGWLDFLGNSRAVLGVEGGASLLDTDGSVRDKTREYMSLNPEAKFEDVEAVCFPGMDNHLNLFCISPRHFEAAQTKTCQILLEGAYNGILRANIDYVPVSKDYSNIEDVLTFLEDDAKVKVMVDEAYNHVIKSGNNTYSRFMKRIEAEIEPLLSPERQSKRLSIRASFVLSVRNRLNWNLIRLELLNQRKPWLFKPFKAVLSPIFQMLTDKQGT